MSDSNPRTKKTILPPHPPWMDLSEDIWGNILQRLGAKEKLKTAQMVCATWRRVCYDPSMWRVIHIKYLDGDMPLNFDAMCRHAVDRSQGGLLDIHLEFSVTCELLDYIAERSAKLRRFSIACSYYSVCHGLANMFQKLPLLEELSLTIISIDKEGFEALGRYCPLLKSFELNFPLYVNSVEYSEEEEYYYLNYDALAIAKNMPSLCHLQLIGNSMMNGGLQAILNGCPHLVSLDLRGCSNVYVEKVLSSKYLLQIKDLKYPHDSLADFAYEPPEDVEAHDYYDLPWGSSEEENEIDYVYHYSL